MKDLTDLSYRCYTTSCERAKHVPHLKKEQWIKNLAGEVIELQDAISRFRTLKSKDKDCTEAYKGVQEELADVFIYTLMIAFDYGIDIEHEVDKKMEINEKRALGIGDKL